MEKSGIDRFTVSAVLLADHPHNIRVFPLVAFPDLPQSLSWDPSLTMMISTSFSF